ncbi:MAG: ABC transporter permease [Gemmatimonadaceae bacterium]
MLCGDIDAAIYFGATSTASARDAWRRSATSRSVQLSVGRRSHSAGSSVACDSATRRADSRGAVAAIHAAVFEVRRTDAPGAHGRRPPASAADQWTAGIQIVTPKYFMTMGIPIGRGRDFDDSDRFSEQQFTDSTIPRPSGVAIINEAMAKRFWPDGNPLGAMIFLQDDGTFAAFRTTVGVVRDARAESVAAPATPSVFLPFAQHPGGRCRWCCAPMFRRTVWWLRSPSACEHSTPR